MTIDVEPDIAEQIEGDARRPCPSGLVPVYLSSPPGGREVEPAADDPAAAFVEDHRQHAVERAGELDPLEAEAVDELLRIEALKLERQPLGARADRNSAPSRGGSAGRP